ncbi:DUF2605 domain-containing protein [Aphanothece hegewaldii CCALA 016]|uniref:DUF2605 domain-containing protein n=1 Tax=Aphanothece hegewaldii CCALA 016 TaxID=2107694 RepID=A0A2T1M195_9CHRO|nr:DUF2605 domain-containing protein [Aphanothece hegewaldii]PSF38447.1 DUF2605 domain-containing protein [Aphanothece hegewaldii CCALA 016]
MFNPQPTSNELLKTVLEPLLEDFQYWFSRAQVLLESESLTILSEDEQANLLERVKQAQQEVSTAQMLFKAIGEQAGIEPSMLLPWHHLVAECWQVSLKWRSFKKEMGQI